MKKIREIIVIICLIASFSIAVQATEEDKMLKIGLFYDTDALPSANLQNVTGTGEGYGFGFFDSTNKFIELWSTKQVFLTVLKDKPMWIGTGNVYFDTLPANFSYTVGAYHLELPTVFSTALDAANHAEQMSVAAFPAYVNGEYRVRVGDYMSQDLASAAQGTVGQGATVVGASRTCYTVTVTGLDKILFEFDNGGTAFAISPKGKNGVQGEAWFKKYSYFGGLEYKRVNGNDISVTSVVNMRQYIKGVVPYEMSASWPLEALKTQALCARSYAYNSKGKHSAQGFDLCNTTHCQVYYGTASANANSDNAVEQTDSQYVLYNGKVAQTYYHSGSGGSTEDVENVWGSVLPYLRGVKDQYLTKQQPWSFSISLSEVSSVLRNKGKTSKNIVDMYISEFTDMGNVRSITFVEEGGKKLTYNGDNARTILNTSSSSKTVKSLRYTISPNVGMYINDKPIDKGLQQYYAIGSSGTTQITAGNSEIKLATGNGTVSAGSTATSFLVSGTGWGHNVGMSQWGAHAMASAGLGYEQIIKHYYTGVEIGTFEY